MAQKRPQAPKKGSVWFEVSLRLQAPEATKPEDLEASLMKAIDHAQFKKEALWEDSFCERVRKE